jgi:hypothetical protein
VEIPATKRAGADPIPLRNHCQVGEAEKIIPINHETAEMIAQQKKFVREQFGREPGPEEYEKQVHLSVLLILSVQSTPAKPLGLTVRWKASI